MKQNRIERHPILEVPGEREVEFTFDGKKLVGKEGEMLSSALIANGIHIFGHHHKDGAPQGIFCANGQCSQCLVIADGKPVKSCMTPLREGTVVESVEGLPELPADDEPEEVSEIPVRETDVLVIGGGPSWGSWAWIL